METSDEEDVDYPLPSFTQDTPNLVVNRCTKSDQFYKEFVDLKKYMFGEMINIKSYVVNNSNKTTTEHCGSSSFEMEYLRERNVSLEKEVTELRKMVKDLVENICERQNHSIEKSNQIIHVEQPNHDHTQYNKGDANNNTNHSTKHNQNIRIKAELNNWQQVRYNTNSRQHNRNSLVTTNNHDKTLSLQNRFSALDFNDDSNHDVLNISKNCTQTDVDFMQRKTGGGKQQIRRRPSPVINQYANNDINFKQPRTVPGEKSYKDAVNPIINNHKIVIFTDSIPKGIRYYEFNKHINRGSAKFKTFPGLKSNELLHYIEPTLQEETYDAAIIHVGVNDMINGNQEKIDALIQNLQNLANKCVSYGVKKVFISGITFTKRINQKTLDKVNDLIMKLCEENCLHYINNKNITIRHLFKDGLHLLESGKCALANNFIDSLNHFLLRQPRAQDLGTRLITIS